MSDKKEPERVPYYVQRQPDGTLDFPGDSPAALDADVHYARSAGLDYFIFGYYLESSSWGRDINASRRLNQALGAYLGLKSRQGVKFALSFNWTFPPQDVALVSAAVSNGRRWRRGMSAAAAKTVLTTAISKLMP